MAAEDPLTALERAGESIPVAPEGFRSGFVGIVGRPNVGKSTLMNQLVGQQVAITSSVAQTTRNCLQGIATGEQAQLIFVDTPGIHKPHHELARVLVANARNTIDAVDAVLLVVDASVPLGGGDRFIARLLAASPLPVVLALNKRDRQPPDCHPLDAGYTELAQANGWSYCKVSAAMGAGLAALQQQLVAQLPVGPYYYPPDAVTDQPERFIMAEAIREQVLHQTRNEIPHSVAITIDRIEEAPEQTAIWATICVERKSQKGILIGKHGSMLKAIGTAARERIQAIVAGKVHLELFVRVQPKWRQSRRQLAELGYELEA